MKQIKTKQGTIAGLTGKDTVVVEVVEVQRHPVYQKSFKNTKRFQAHASGREFTVGDKVTIAECRPISKNKQWRVLPTKNR